MMSKIIVGAVCVLFSLALVHCAELSAEEWADSDVIHLDTETFQAQIDQGDTLVMFYAPWCGHCKKLKPDFASAAAKLKSGAAPGGTIAAVDCTENRPLCQAQEVTGYPRLKYFKNADTTFLYESGRNEKSLLAFMADPKPAPPKPPPEPFSKVPTEVTILDTKNYQQFMADNDKALVFFYAPWCGHCKKAKPEFIKAAAELKDAGVGALAAVDCDAHRPLCQKNGVKGFPTILYMVDGKEQTKYAGARGSSDFVSFMKDPTKAPKPMGGDKKKKDSAPLFTADGPVAQLTDATFEAAIAGDDYSLVMFYAPWCGHCKKLKPAFISAAQKMKDAGSKGQLAAVDCTIHKKVCSAQEVKGYPTIKLFKNGEFESKYSGGRDEKSLLAYMKDPSKPAPKPAAGEKAAVKRRPDGPREAFVEGEDNVPLLTADNFAAETAKMEHALIMFYAPWCGHCKKAKPDYSKAAVAVKGTNKHIVAVDCTQDRDICDTAGVRGFPTIQYYNNGKNVEKYAGARTTDAWVEFLAGKAGAATGTAAATGHDEL